MALVISFAAGPASLARADEAGYADAGHAFANAACAECHSIEPGAKSSPNIKATPFAQLAKHPRLTARDIDGWLTASHVSMPAIAVPPEKRANLIAYIKSLALKP